MIDTQADPAVPHPGPWDVDCVIIGVNAATTLGLCIESILASAYDAGKVRLYYVDGGSTDNSVELARRFSGVEVISLQPEHPTPGLGRNAGWKAGTAPLVQFVDSDTELHPQWLRKAAEFLAKWDHAGAVRGNRSERHPEASVYNWIADREWNGPPGECEAFGGDVMIRRAVLDETGGYDETLVGGEDPELSVRVRLQGHRIFHLDAPMTVHDIAMKEWRQYWRRAYRTGYGFAAVALRFLTRSRGFWAHEIVRIMVRGGGSVVFFLLGLLLSPWKGAFTIAFWGVALILLLFPRLFRVDAFMRNMKLSPRHARIYAWHCSLVVVPEFFGAMRYLVGAMAGRPLRNKSRLLETRALGARSTP